MTSKKKPHRDVVAALIFRSDENGKKEFFICQRPATKSNPLLWEFVGGKVEDGESPEKALVRECREELDAMVKVGKPYFEVDHKYPDIFIHLTLFFAEFLEAPRMLEHHGFAWISPDEIPNYRFCPADKDILEQMIKDFKTVR